jgi:AcrR family transcriptional regulator
VERPRKKRVRKSKAVRRSEITEATLALIGKYGLQGTSVSRISEAVGLSKGALYRHFPSRDAVIAAVIGLMRERASSWLGQSSSTDAVQYLTELGDRHADWAADQFETFVHPMFELAAGGVSIVRGRCRRRQAPRAYQG